MNIGLDYDGTANTDIPLWLQIVKLMREAGNKVYIVTMRYKEEALSDGPNFKAIPIEFLNAVDGLICTERKAKRKVMDELGIKIAYWIDDNPLAVEKNASEIWGVSTPKGIVVNTVEEAEKLCPRPNTVDWHPV